MAANTKVDLKVVMLGRAHVGKSCLVERFLHDRWTGDQAPTVGAHFGARSIPVGDGSNKSLTLGLWDTAGSERFESMTRHYYKGADGAVICYDLTEPQSWDKVKFWIREVTTIEESCILAIVGTKLDLITSGARNRSVPRDAAQSYAAAINARYYEVSALTGIDTSTPFVDIVKEYAKRPKKRDNEIKAYSPVIDLNSHNRKGNEEGSGRRNGGCNC